MNMFKIPLHQNVTYTRRNQGNILLAILMTIGLMGLLSIVVSKGMSGAKGTSDSEMKMHAEKMLRYTESVRNAVQFMYTTSNIKETEFLFAHPKNDSFFGDDTDVTSEHQVFSELGGGAKFLWPIPEGLNDGTPWEFFAKSRAPFVGEDTVEDLMIALPNVTESFCRAVNETLGYTENDPIPTDASGCGFNDGYMWDGQYPSGGGGIANNFDSSDFIYTPATYGCVQCDSDSLYYFYHVLLAR